MTIFAVPPTVLSKERNFLSMLHAYYDCHTKDNYQ